MRCRSCDAPITPVVDLGDQPAVGGFPLADDPPDPRLRLRLGICDACGLAQLADDSPPEADEPDAPSPLSSATMATHARSFVDDLAARGLASESSRILSFASHGGHLAPFLVERGLTATVLEASPARAARLGAESMDVVVGQFDGPDWPAGLEPASYDLMLDNYLLAHLEHPRVALARLTALLAPGGTLVLEFDHLLAKVLGGQWDAVRHGHQAYLALGWLARELAKLGLAVIDAVEQPVYGGALRVYARAGSARGEAVRRLIALEESAAIEQAAGLEPLAQAVRRARHEVVAHLGAFRDRRRRVAGYGAPARSVTFLNALGIGPDLLPYVVDRALAKQGRTIPGVRIPIRSPGVLADERPDELLILTWDLAVEVASSLSIPELAGTRFLVALPGLAEVAHRAQSMSAADLGTSMR